MCPQTIIQSEAIFVARMALGIQSSCLDSLSLLHLSSQTLVSLFDMKNDSLSYDYTNAVKWAHPNDDAVHATIKSHPRQSSFCGVMSRRIFQLGT